MRVLGILLVFALVGVSVICRADTLPTVVADATLAAQDSHHHEGTCAPALSTASAAERLFQPVALLSGTIDTLFSTTRAWQAPSALACSPTPFALQAPPLRL